MKIFHCGRCDNLVFFENTLCVSCGHTLAYLPDRTEVSALEPAGEDRWRALSSGANGREYRLCPNYTTHKVCNWAVTADDPNPFCASCRVTRIIPDLNRPGAQELWASLEAAKRRLIYSLLCLELPIPGKADDPENGLAFEFRADPETPGAPHVLTGHKAGVITINIAEANDAEREMRRHALKEGYRTLLGHFRHEIGHFYWDRLVKGTNQIDGFRRLFGDERADYVAALARHHRQGAPANWTTSFVSAYASAHPWEDWAETWAHYLHVTDTLETAVACGLTLHPGRPDEPTLRPDVAIVGDKGAVFDRMIEAWFPLTYVLNNLNRGMGIQDAYPFVLPPPAIEKLRFVHDLIRDAAPGRPEPAGRSELFKRLGFSNPPIPDGTGSPLTGGR